MGRLNTSSCYFLPQRYSRSDGDDTYNCRPIIVCRLPHWPTSSTTTTVARRPTGVGGGPPLCGTCL